MPTLSRPANEPIAWHGATGYVQDLWVRGAVREAWGFAPTPDNTHIFLCGSPGMIDEPVELLSREGYREQTRKEPGQINVERYW